jgi:hypothetical protein
MTKQSEDQLKKKQVKTKNTLETMHIFFFQGQSYNFTVKRKKKIQKIPLCKFNGYNLL